MQVQQLVALRRSVEDLGALRRDLEGRVAALDAQLEQAHHMQLADVDTTQIDRQSLILSGGHTCSAALWSAESRREHHLRVGSPLRSTRFLPGNRAVVAGPRGIMVLELGSRLLSRFEPP